jgi:hypothetical protein
MARSVWALTDKIALISLALSAIILMTWVLL